MMERLRAQFGDAIESAEEVGRELRVRLPARSLLDVVRYAEENGFSYPADITAVDTGSELQMIYRLVSLHTGQHLLLCVGLPRAGARIPSLSAIYGGADWLEREVYDLFGVRFEGHPNLQRILLTDDWEGYPLLKK
jgi:NADH:ubiquinone oxidoreductase subunit C